ncbi:hypothetical protein HMEPL2_23220 [Vreelandella aquamarina]|uniref:Uncharacterized protein n=1 Tax=Vreelandella aquamarina TaxID=77097 RepID=A0A6F8XC58_9GAMM|nr:hypothetical protein HMEPL2_23220 [Halomonas meridiana]
MDVWANAIGLATKPKATPNTAAFLANSLSLKNINYYSFNIEPVDVGWKPIKRLRLMANFTSCQGIQNAKNTT